MHDLTREVEPFLLCGHRPAAGGGFWSAEEGRGEAADGPAAGGGPLSRDRPYLQPLTRARAGRGRSGGAAARTASGRAGRTSLTPGESPRLSPFLISAAGSDTFAEGRLGPGERKQLLSPRRLGAQGFVQKEASAASPQQPGSAAGPPWLARAAPSPTHR